MTINDLPTGDVIPTNNNLNPKGVITEDDLLPGDILLSPPPPLRKSWKGQAIVKVTGCKTSHTAIYCGKDSNGDHVIAHSADEGIKQITMKKHFIEDETPLCYVRRHIPQSDKDDVVAAAKRYANMNLPYPIEMFVILGLVLLSKKISERRKLREEYHHLVILLCKIIIEIINTKRNVPIKYLMNCTHFALQCFEDAGYQINFDKYVLEYRKIEKLTATSRAELKNKLSDGAKSNEEVLKVIEKALSAHEEMSQDRVVEFSLALNPSEQQTVDAFMNMMSEKHQMHFKSPRTADRRKLKESKDILALLLYQLITGMKAESAALALAFITSNEKFFILPDDLLYNTKEFTTIGIIPRSNYVPANFI